MSNENSHLQKTTKLVTEQSAIIKSLSKHCTVKTFEESFKAGNSEIKHFALENGSHAYTVSGDNPARLFSNVELPNITYFSGWNKMLIPDTDKKALNGFFISVSTSLVSYSCYKDGNLVFDCGYFHLLKNPNKVLYFCNFGNSTNNKTVTPFNELPNNVTNLLKLAKIKCLKSQKIPSEQRKEILATIKEFSDFESCKEQKIAKIIYEGTENSITEAPVSVNESTISSSKSNNDDIVTISEANYSVKPTIDKTQTAVDEQPNVSKSPKEQFIDSLKVDTNTNPIPNKKSLFGRIFGKHNTTEQR